MPLWLSEARLCTSTEAPTELKAWLCPASGCCYGPARPICMRLLQTNDTDSLLVGMLSDAVVSNGPVVAP
jgi:hypothetical protein